MSTGEPKSSPSGTSNAEAFDWTIEADPFLM
jgi:hypothetical protein